MKTKQFHRRVWAMVVLLALMVTGMGAALYDLQINNGEEYYKKTQYTIAETQTVESGRGQILDRNGQVLVSNKVIYQVTLDTSLMKTVEERNNTILALIRAARAEGVEWTDNLPISTDEPFRFTTTTPFYTVSYPEEGGAVRTLTQLGRLAVKMKWIDDPTKVAEPAAEAAAPKEPGLIDKIKNFLKGNKPEEAPPPETGPRPLPSAQQLLGQMCASFEIKGEGAVDKKAAEAAGETVPELNIGDMSSEDARALAGVLYELYLRSREVYIASEYVFASDVDIGFISRVKEQDLTGVIIEATTVRQYHTKYAAHLLGRVTPIFANEVEYYTNLDLDGDGEGDYKMNDTVGRGGAEQAFEQYLRGKPGKKTVERNKKGKIMAETWLSEPEPGNNVMLTLDIGLQGYIENLLADSVPKLESEETEGAACVVLDVKNAELLAAASYPSFDLANYNAEYEENASNPLKPFLNRAFQGVYPPGSTFKMITAVAGLEEDIIAPSTKIRDEGRYTYWTDVNPPQCWYYRQYRGYHGLINVTKAIEVSCNYFFFDVGRRLGIDTLVDYANRFGLGERTGLELNESAGVMAGPAFTESLGGTWYEGSITSVAIGQESTQVTMLQLANYIATLVNGGTRNATHLLKEVKSSDFSQVVHTYEPRVLSTIDIQPKNLEAVKAGMLAVTTESASVRPYFQNLPFQVGAKTGSAQVSAQTEAHAVFVCFAPYDDPEIAVAMVVEHGASGSTLASMSAEVLSYYFTAQETREEIPEENTLIR
ncbi:penicillin-binding protein [Pseudoflavonifractor sp. 60]|uniref:penicillin-binding transpeptidase domain-containing protein n=1 Tax=Pseudoflavonifractor sp. 60 TaxID=2304576 RepID=UPI00136E3F79|nr:penicillin-binding transpeptidase domain-containing protein [Pseudoflavonifractor sp. 60]NBI67558.1 penicillin-binding protein [Pseudoflavonifractor sp. 60]